LQEKEYNVRINTNKEYTGITVFGDATSLDPAIYHWLDDVSGNRHIVAQADTWFDLVASGMPGNVLVCILDVNTNVYLEQLIKSCNLKNAKLILLTPRGARLHNTGRISVINRFQDHLEVIAALNAALGYTNQLPRNEDEARVQRPSLSQNETIALQLYVKGNSTNEVAAAMNVQFETAKTYLRRVREKYNKVQRPTSRKYDLALRAKEDGYV
jgi:DNA-binding CsgD family transcriptional regulator